MMTGRITRGSDGTDRCGSGANKLTGVWHSDEAASAGLFTALLAGLTMVLALAWSKSTIAAVGRSVLVFDYILYEVVSVCFCRCLSTRGRTVRGSRFAKKPRNRSIDIRELLPRSV